MQTCVTVLIPLKQKHYPFKLVFLAVLMWVAYGLKAIIQISGIMTMELAFGCPRPKRYQEHLTFLIVLKAYDFRSVLV